MKPNWSDSPSWANYLAMDEDGTWYWYEDIPEDGAIAWFNCGKDCRAGFSNWRDTLEERPVEAEGRKE